MSSDVIVENLDTSLNEYCQQHAGINLRKFFFKQFITMLIKSRKNGWEIEIDFNQTYVKKNNLKFTLKSNNGFKVDQKKFLLFIANLFKEPVSDMTSGGDFFNDF